MHTIKHTKRINDKTALRLSNSKFFQHNSNSKYRAATKRERDPFLPTSKVQTIDFRKWLQFKFQEINKFISYKSIYLDLLSIYQDM